LNLLVLFASGALSFWGMKYLSFDRLSSTVQSE
jgi:hypothetical protein